MGVNINKGDYDKRTVLHLASAEGHEDIVKYLILKSVNVNATDRWGKKPIDDAIINNNTSIIEVSDIA
ncbi:MAG: ankyrin repeat domain-containing protein [Francisella endosymbiont of Hyalomma asiaticum]